MVLRLAGIVFTAVLVAGVRPFCAGAGEIVAAAEPAYCNPAGFPQREIPVAADGLHNLQKLHAFRLGRVVVAGLAVGNSEAAAVRDLARRFSPAMDEAHWCTWYVNNGNAEAARSFNFHYVPNPAWLSEETAPRAYLEALGSSFADDPESLLSCAKDHGYVALGCDGMMHRGPTLYGMLLAYSGCRPENAAQIVNAIWGLNGVSPDVRLAIIRASYDFGRAHPEQSARLRDLLSR